MIPGGCSKPVVVIEHLEDGLSPWILLEYRHLSSFYGLNCVVFTNIPEKYHRILSRYGTPVKESIIEIVNSGVIKPGEVIILDPASPSELTYEILSRTKYVVVGGILGDHPPKKRTWELISSRLKSIESYNIGDGQYSIDGAVYYIYYMYSNKGMEGYKYVDGVSIRNGDRIIHLPFRYPLVEDKPFISSDLIYYILNRRIPDHVWKEIKG